MVLIHLASPLQAGGDTHSNSLPFQHSSQEQRSETAPGAAATTTLEITTKPAQPRIIKFAIQQTEGNVPWIEFPYTRPDGLTLHYTIRCDIDWFDLLQLSAEFKAHNAIYPDATAASCSSSPSFPSSPTYSASDGDSSSFERRNALGWVLAHLNPLLRAPGNPGLLLLAVESWMAASELVPTREL